MGSGCCSGGPQVAEIGLLVVRACCCTLAALISTRPSCCPCSSRSISTKTSSFRLPQQQVQYRYIQLPQQHDVQTPGTTEQDIYIHYINNDIIRHPPEDFTQSTPPQQHWAFLAASSGEPTSFKPDIAIKPIVNPNIQLKAASGTSILMRGYEDVGLILGSIKMSIRFYICDVTTPIIGLNGLIANKGRAACLRASYFLH